MKKLFVTLLILAGSACVFADVIDPHLSDKEYAQIRKQKQERYKMRQRTNYINNICGINKAGGEYDKKFVNSCKNQLKKEYDETVKLLEKIASENKKNAKQAAKNPS